MFLEQGHTIIDINPIVFRVGFSRKKKKITIVGTRDMEINIFIVQFQF